MGQKRVKIIVTIICGGAIGTALFFSAYIGNAQTEKQNTSKAGLQSIERKPEVGFMAPQFSLEKTLQVPKGVKVSWEELHGKVVVLEFWGTWCGACVIAIPHLNELAEEFRDKPVQFISITYEDEPVVSSFLKKKPIHAWIGLDVDRSMVHEYKVKGWPHTVIVNKKGAIAAIMHPFELTAEILNAVLADENVSTISALSKADSDLLATAVLNEESAFIIRAGIDRPNESTPLFRLLIRPPEFTNNSGWVTSKGKLTGRNIVLERMISSAFGFSPARIVLPSSLSNSRYDVVINIPQGKEKHLNSLFRQALELTFDLSFREASQQMEVYLLEAPEGSPVGLCESDMPGGMSSGQGKMIVSGQPIDVLCEYLEDYLRKPVIDETGLTKTYDFELKWDNENPESIIKSVESQLGLKVVEAVKTIKVLIVEESNRKKNL